MLADPEVVQPTFALPSSNLILFGQSHKASVSLLCRGSQNVRLVLQLEVLMNK